VLQHLARWPAIVGILNSTALGRVPFASFEFGEIDAELC
jgi:hypothetical protein